LPVRAPVWPADAGSCSFSSSMLHFTLVYHSQIGPAHYPTWQPANATHQPKLANHSTAFDRALSATTSDVILHTWRSLPSPTSTTRPPVSGLYSSRLGGWKESARGTGEEARRGRI
jgi:hypothetical protein